MARRRADEAGGIVGGDALPESVVLDLVPADAACGEVARGGVGENPGRDGGRGHHRAGLGETAAAAGVTHPAYLGNRNQPRSGERPSQGAMRTSWLRANSSHPAELSARWRGSRPCNTIASDADAQ